jgi:DNA mismatch repair protein MutS
LAKGTGRSPVPAADQLGLFSAPPHPVIEKLKSLNVDGLTPLAALTLLASLIDEAR